MARRDKGSGSVFYNERRQTWQAQLEVGYTKSGNRRYVTMNAPTKREALQRLQAKKRELLMTGDTGDMRTLTVKAYAATWLQIQEHRLAPSSYSTSHGALANWIIPTIGHRQLGKLSAADVRAVQNSVLAAGRSDATARRTHSVLAKMLKDAVRDGHHIPTGAILTEAPPQGRADRGAIPTIHARKILESAALEPDFSRWVAAFYAALRPAEARGLTWANVDLERGLLRVQWQLQALPYNRKRDVTSGFRVPRGYVAVQLEGAHHLVDPKTRAGDRYVPLVPALQKLLVDWRGQAPNSHDLVWPTVGAKNAAHNGRPRTDSQDRRAWKRIVERAGVTKPDGTPYALYEARHTAATLLREMGATDEEITLMMGHSSVFGLAPVEWTRFLCCLLVLGVLV